MQIHFGSITYLSSFSLPKTKNQKPNDVLHALPRTCQEQKTEQSIPDAILFRLIRNFNNTIFNSIDFWFYNSNYTNLAIVRWINTQPNIPDSQIQILTKQIKLIPSFNLSHSKTEEKRSIEWVKFLTEMICRNIPFNGMVHHCYHHTKCINSL